MVDRSVFAGLQRCCIHMIPKNNFVMFSCYYKITFCLCRVVTASVVVVVVVVTVIVIIIILIIIIIIIIIIITSSN